jgi:hypothetical protein
VCGHLDYLAVGEGLKGGIRRGRRASQLNVESACKEKSSERQGCGEEGAAAQKVKGREQERDCCGYQENWRTEEMSAGKYSCGIGECGPEHGLARGFEVEFKRGRGSWGRCDVWRRKHRLGGYVDQRTTLRSVHYGELSRVLTSAAQAALCERYMAPT